MYGAHSQEFNICHLLLSDSDSAARHVWTNSLCKKNVIHKTKPIIANAGYGALRTCTTS